MLFGLIFRRIYIYKKQHSVGRNVGPLDTLSKL